MWRKTPITHSLTRFILDSRDMIFRFQYLFCWKCITIILSKKETLNVVKIVMEENSTKIFTHEKLFRVANDCPLITRKRFVWRFYSISNDPMIVIDGRSFSDQHIKHILKINENATLVCSIYFQHGLYKNILFSSDNCTLHILSNDYSLHWFIVNMHCCNPSCKNYP